MKYTRSMVRSGMVLALAVVVPACGERERGRQSGERRNRFQAV